MDAIRTVQIIMLVVAALALATGFYLVIEQDNPAGVVVMGLSAMMGALVAVAGGLNKKQKDTNDAG